MHGTVQFAHHLLLPADHHRGSIILLMDLERRLQCLLDEGRLLCMNKREREREREMDW